MKINYFATISVLFSTTMLLSGQVAYTTPTPATSSMTESSAVPSLMNTTSNIMPHTNGSIQQNNAMIIATTTRDNITENGNSNSEDIRIVNPIPANFDVSTTSTEDEGNQIDTTTAEAPRFVKPHPYHADLALIERSAQVVLYIVHEIFQKVDPKHKLSLEMVIRVCNGEYEKSIYYADLPVRKAVMIGDLNVLVFMKQIYKELNKLKMIKSDLELDYGDILEKEYKEKEQMKQVKVALEQDVFDRCEDQATQHKENETQRSGHHSSNDDYEKYIINWKNRKSVIYTDFVNDLNNVMGNIIDSLYPKVELENWTYFLVNTVDSIQAMRKRLNQICIY